MVQLLETYNNLVSKVLVLDELVSEVLVQRLETYHTLHRLGQSYHCIVVYIFCMYLFILRLGF